MKSQELSKAPDQVTAEDLKKYLKAANLVAHLNENEVEQFISISQAYGLNPFKREIYASKYGNNFSIVVGYETYIKRAERSGRLDGWKVETTGEVNDQAPKKSSLKAVITIFRDDFKHPFVHEVHFSEYVQFNRQGQVTKFWKDKPITMIKKVAISQGFRMCFSDELGGIPYTKEEIGEEASFEVVSSGPLKKNVPEPSNVTQPTPTPEPVKEVKKPTFEEVKDVLQASLNDCKTRQDVADLWNANAEFKTEDEFVQMIKEAGERIEATPEAEAEDLEEIQEAEVVEEEKDQEEDNSPGPLFPSSDYDAKDSIKFIRKMNDADEIISFTENESRKSVLDLAKEKIEKLQNA